MADEGAGGRLSSMRQGVTTAFSRARQFTEERVGRSEKTEYDQHFENLLARADRAKLWTERLVRQTEAVVRPSPNERLENFVYTKLDRHAPVRNTPVETLGQQMIDAGHEFGDIPLGRALSKCGEVEKNLGAAQKEFVGTAVQRFVQPMKTFLDEEMKTIGKERALLNRKRLDLDAAKAKHKRAKTTERMQAVDQEVRQAKDDFERQYEVTKLLLEGLSNSQMSQLRFLQEFIEGQETYHRKCADMLQQLTDEVRSAFTVASAPPLVEEAGDAPLDSIAFSSAPVTRRAKVLYDYDAQSSLELSVLADEVITVYNAPGLDSDYMMAERSGEKGRVPVAYIELL